MVQEALKSFFAQQWQDVKEDKYSFAATILLLSVLSGYGAYKAHGWYVAHKEGKAQLVFSQALEEYDRALLQLIKGEVEQDLWHDAGFAFKVVEQQHAGTVYAQYAQAFQADISARQGNFQDALEQLDIAINTLGVKSPGWYLFKTKRALLQFDAGNLAGALTDLQELADDAKNPQSDTAAFYLGYYYWTKQDTQKAQEIWKRFSKEEQPTDPQKVSPWAEIVQVKLSQIS